MRSDESDLLFIVKKEIMTLSFYNSLSKKKENFIPIEDSNVRLYTCGPTVYDVAHIGNFSTFSFEDLLKRFLMFKDYSVTHVMNITDVDDKTIRRSIKEGIALSELTQKYTKTISISVCHQCISLH